MKFEVETSYRIELLLTGD